MNSYFSEATFGFQPYTKVEYKNLWERPKIMEKLKIKLMMVKVKLIYLVYFMDFIIWSTVGRYLSNKSGIVLYTMVYVVVL